MSTKTTAAVPAFPLQWPAGKPRTPDARRKSNPFQVSLARSRDELVEQVYLLGGRAVVVSSNIPVRQDGLPYANSRQPDDPGVAVYFTDREGRPVCLAVDQYRRAEANLRAIRLTLEDMRSIERHGGSEMLRQAFTGFAALGPAPGAVAPRKWWEVFGCPGHTPTVDVAGLYRSLSLERHPDKGGTNDQQAELNAAYAEFKRERGL